MSQSDNPEFVKAVMSHRILANMAVGGQEIDESQVSYCCQVIAHLTIVEGFLETPVVTALKKFIAEGNSDEQVLERTKESWARTQDLYRIHFLGELLTRLRSLEK